MKTVQIAAACCVAYFFLISSAKGTAISKAETLFVHGHQDEAIRSILSRINDGTTSNLEKAELTNCLAWMEYKQGHSDLEAAKKFAELSQELNSSRESFRRDVEKFEVLKGERLPFADTERQEDPRSLLISVTTPENARASVRTLDSFTDALLRERVDTPAEWQSLWHDALSMDGGTSVFEILTTRTANSPAAIIASTLPRLRAGKFREAHDRLRPLLPRNAASLRDAPNPDAIYTEVLIDIATDELLTARRNFYQLETADPARALVLEAAGMENFTDPARPPSIEVKVSFLLMVMQTEQVFASEVYNGIFARAVNSDKQQFMLAVERLQNFDIAYVRDDFRVQLAALDRQTAEHFYVFEQASKAKENEILANIAGLRGEMKSEYDETRAQVGHLFRKLDLQQVALDQLAYNITVIRAKQNDADVAKRISDDQVKRRLDDLSQQLATVRQNYPKEWKAIEERMQGKLDRLADWRKEKDHGEVVALIVEVGAHVLAEAGTVLAVRIAMNLAPLLLLLA